MELLTTIGINWQLLIAQIVNFLIVMGVLTALVYKPLLDLLDKRANRIRSAMDEAKRLEEETRQMEAHRQQRLKKVDEETAAMLAEAHKKGEAMYAQMINKAHEETKTILEKGRLELQAEKAQALREVKGVLADAVVGLTEKLLARTFTPEDHKKAVASVTAEIPSILK